MTREEKAEKIIHMIDKNNTSMQGEIFEVDWVQMAAEYRELVRIAIGDPEYFESYIDNLLGSTFHKKG